ncbi:MAG: VOC family protein [Hyphomicrobiales bacterium]
MNDTTGFGAIRSMDYVIILCDDLDKMRGFYSDLFGFQIEDEEPGHWVGFRVGTLFLGLRPRERPYDGPAPKQDAASVQLSFRVPPADVDKAYQTLVDKGIDVIEPPTNQDWCHCTLFFADPENNVIEIYADIHPRDTASTPSKIHRSVT